SGPPVLHAIGNGRCQKIGHGYILRMKSTFCPGAGDTVADTEARICRIDLLDDSGSAVSQRRRTFQSVSDFLQSGAPTESAGCIEDLANLIRASSGLLQQVHFGLLDLHLLGADADY